MTAENVTGVAERVITADEWVDPDELTPLHRCDRCSQQAWFAAHLAHGPLYFCGHHARRHRAAITKAGARIIDNTAELDKEHGPDRERDGDHA